jgi:hypothetical protein
MGREDIHPDEAHARLQDWASAQPCQRNVVIAEAGYPDGKASMSKQKVRECAKDDHTANLVRQ